MSNLVRIRKGKITKRIPLMQWESMLKNNATYGWGVSTELPEEIAEVEEKIISETAVTQTAEPEDVKSTEIVDVEATKQGNITNILNVGVRAIKDELPHLTKDELNSLSKAEKGTDEPRKSLIDIIEKQIKKFS